MAHKIFQTWGEWRLYPGKPATIGCMPYGNRSVYHIKVSQLTTPEGQAKWLKQIMEKSWGDVIGLRAAIRDINMGLIRISNNGKRGTV